jgi:hypothetical protein
MLTALILTLIIFAANSLVLTLYFSAIIFGLETKSTIHRDALKITFPGTALGSVFVFLHWTMPINPMRIGPFSSPMDIAISVGAISWLVLTKHYCRTDWLSAILVTAVAVIISTFMIFFINTLFIVFAAFFLR